MSECVNRVIYGDICIHTANTDIYVALNSVLELYLLVVFCTFLLNIHFMRSQVEEQCSMHHISIAGI